MANPEKFKRARINKIERFQSNYRPFPHSWTKYSDLYVIVHPSLVLIFLCLLTGAECGKGLLNGSIMIYE